MITISRPESYSCQGGRENNEDSCYPLVGHANSCDRLFMVCDGVGGQEAGEVASQIVCATAGAYFRRHAAEAVDTSYIGRLVEALYDALATAAEQGLGSQNMGSTMTLLYLDEAQASALVAHMGDSRVYQVRPNAESPIVFRTRDHSLVQDLVDMGEITPEEAMVHPRKNVITRALQPFPKVRQKAQVDLIEDLEAGDVFLLCSDGVLEQCHDEDIASVLSQPLALRERSQALQALSAQGTNDNYTAYLVEVTAAKRDSALLRPGVEGSAALYAVPADEVEMPVQRVHAEGTGRWRGYWRWGLIVLLVALLGAYVLYMHDWQEGADKKANSAGSKASTPEVAPVKVVPIDTEEHPRRDIKAGEEEQKALEANSKKAKAQADTGRPRKSTQGANEVNSGQPDKPKETPKSGAVAGPPAGESPIAPAGKQAGVTPSKKIDSGAVQTPTRPVEDTAKKAQPEGQK